MALSSFLNEIANILTSETPEGFKHSLIVVPGKRSELYLTEELKSLISSPGWLPEMTTLGELKSTIVGDTPLPVTDCVFKLFKEYSSITGLRHDSFESFLKWGPSILNDFNSVDNYLLDGTQVFSDLQDVQDIEEWSFRFEELSVQQKSFSNFWNIISELYNAYRNAAISNGWYYSGLHSRKASEIIEQKGRINAYEKIHFVGFNALSPSEQKIVYKLVNTGQASTYWDIDNLILKDERHEAGRFMRGHLEKLGSLRGVSNNLETDCPKINAIACSTEIGQVKAVSKLLRESDGDLEHTAIVLANEGLLVPLLHSLPASIKKSNVTLGYPLSNGQLFQFIELTREVLADRFTKSKGIHHEKLILLLKHSLIQHLCDFEKKDPEAWIRDIKAKNTIRIQPENLQEIVGLAMLKNWLMALVNPDVSLCSMLREMLRLLSSLGNRDMWVREQLFLVDQLINQLESTFAKYHMRIDDDSFYRLFIKESKQLTVSFIGEPLEGLQILGMLETRALDFERIIILGANEGQFPPNRGNDSFIPIALRRHLGLPDGKDQHALYAYYVYRLLHRSRQVDFVYSQAESIIGNNEISHLIYQINNDVPKASVQFCTMQIGVPNSREAFGVYSDEAIQNRTRELLARGISASALNTFLRCPLDFYYKYLVNLREPNEVEEQIGLATYGTIVHDVLESAYRGLIGQALSTSDIDKILLGLHERVDFSTQKIFQDREMDFGINLLTKESAYASLVRFFKWEQSQIEHLATMGQHLQINTLETKLEADIHVEGHLIKMKGVIDRIDYCCDQLRIIDYKTGGVEQKDLNLDSSFIKILDGNQPKALQLLTYGYLWKKNMAKSDNLSAGIISLKNISNDFIPLTEDKKPFNWLGIEEQFSDLMRQIVSRMLSPELSYIHNSKSDYCSYCP